MTEASITLNTRRQRSKKEGCFLEGVKDSLQKLSDEIVQVKLLVTQLMGSCQYFDPYAGCTGADMEYWRHWSPMETWHAAEQETSTNQMLNLFQDLTSKTIAESRLDFAGINGDGIEDAPSCQPVYNRGFLLSYRTAAVPKKEDVLLPTVWESSSNEKAESSLKLRRWLPCSKQEFIREGTQTRVELQHEAACVIQRYYHKYLATMRLVSCWLPLEEWKQATSNNRQNSYIMEHLVHDGCRDYDVGIWFRISFGHKEGTETVQTKWEENRCKEWVLKVISDIELAPTLPVGAQQLMKSWQQAREHFPLAVQQTLFTDFVCKRLSFLRKMILKCAG